MVEIDALSPQDRTAWEALARGYKAFYRTEVSDEGYEEMWRRLRDGGEVRALGARADGKLVGIAHYLFHASGWMAESCYLQDLYVDEGARGRGVARALIERVAGAARERGAARLYWSTQEDNATARALYDTVADFKGFIRYDYRLS